MQILESAHEISNETSNGKLGQRKAHRRFIHIATSTSRNVCECWRCF